MTIFSVLFVCQPLAAEITGQVLEEGTGSPGQPIVGARVHIQADSSSPVVTTDAAGLFTLLVSPAGTVKITAALTYDPDGQDNFTTGGVNATDGQDVEIRLARIPDLENFSYTPIKAAVPGGCGDCHGDQLAAWSQSSHALAATDVWVRDLYSGDGTSGGSAGYVFRDVHPGETGFCATCHAPVAEAAAPGTIFLDEVQAAAALEGVTCSACHQLDRFSDNLQALHLVGDPEPGAAYRFPLEGVGGHGTHEFVWGSLDDVDYAFMRASSAPVFSSSKMCATCHEYTNPTTGAPGQTTYSEWAASAYAQPGPGFRSCQNCHMAQADKAGRIADPVIGSAPIRPAEERHDHGFSSTDPTGIELSSQVFASGGRLRVEVSVANTGSGHSFPTGVSIRNAILLIRASHLSTPLEQAAGEQIPGWASDEVAGQQEGDWAGFPGTGFAKVLSGEIDGKRVEPVLFFDADSVASNTNLAAGENRVISAEFTLPQGVTPGDDIDLDIRLLYRRAWRALAVTKGWTETPAGGPIEVPVIVQTSEVELDESYFPLFADDFESGNTNAWSF